MNDVQTFDDQSAMEVALVRLLTSSPADVVLFDSLNVFMDPQLRHPVRVPAPPRSATVDDRPALDNPATIDNGASDDSAAAASGGGARHGRRLVDFTMALLAPGPILPAAGDLTDWALTESVVDAIRTVNIAQGRQMHLLSELAHRRAGTAVTQLTGRRAYGREAVGIGAQAVADELALELTLSRFDATRLVEQAVGLALDAAPTLTALQTGDIDLRKADAILDRVQTLLMAATDDPDCADPQKMAEELQKRILPNAPFQPAAIMKRAATKEMINLDPSAAERRHTVKRERRHVRLTPLDDAMCELSAYLPADQAMKTMAALTALAEAAKTPGDERTLDQRRLDALIDAVINAMHALDGTGIEHRCEHPDHHHADHPIPTDSTASTASTASADSTDSTASTDRTASTASTDSTASTASADSTDSTASTDSTDSTASTASADSTDSTQSTESAPHPDGAVSSEEGCNDTKDRLDDTRCPVDDFERRHGETAPNPSEEAPSPSSSTTQSTNSGAGTGKSFIRRPECKPAAARKPDAEVVIVIDAETFAGLNDDAAYLNGYGPILASMARDIAATGTWRCAVTNAEHGTLDGLGTKTYGPGYAPSQKLRRHLSLRDRKCRFPGCSAAARRCDVDHVCRYPDGVTCECNTECLCPHHHRIKHETGFQVRFSTDPTHPPGTLIWTTPGGREHLSFPEPLHSGHDSKTGGTQKPEPADGRPQSYTSLLIPPKIPDSEGDSGHGPASESGPLPF